MQNETELRPFEVAQLAVQLNPRLGNETEKTGPALHRAIQILADAGEAIRLREEHREQLVVLRKGVLTMEPEEWNKRIEAYAGDKRDLEALNRETVPAGKVHAQLWRNKSLTKQHRLGFFLNLVKWARDHGLRPPPTRESGTFPQAPAKLDADNGGKAWADSVNESRQSEYNAIVERYRADLNVPELRFSVVRWAVEVRQHQESANKKRVIPQSLREGENIQRKRHNRR